MWRILDRSVIILRPSASEPAQQQTPCICRLLGHVIVPPHHFHGRMYQCATIHVAFICYMSPAECREVIYIITILSVLV